MNRATFNGKVKKIMTGSAIGIGTVLMTAITVFAATVVTPTNLLGWSTADTRPGGSVNFIFDSSAPSGVGALQLITDATVTSKAQFMHSANVAIDDITDLGYYSIQNSASFSGGNVSYQLVTLLNGTSGFTTFVYEPYQNGTVIPDLWQSWDVDSGQFWSTRTVTCSNGGVMAGSGGAPFYTLTQIQTMCPEAMVIGFGVNIGSNNPSYDVETDLVNFNGTEYDFEPAITPGSDKNDCKNGGWMSFNSPTFTNQGQCVSYIESNDNAGKRN